MRSADPANLMTGVQAVRATAGAVVGLAAEVFGADGETFDATLTVDANAEVPAATLLRSGTTHRAVVQAGPDRRGLAARKLCVKIPDAYGRGKDQDFLMASSGDGAPLHHAVVPSDPVAPLYSSLWLYLVGWQPVLFGVRPSTTGRDVRFAPGDELSFMVSPPVGQFRRIGALTLTAPHDGPVRFAGSNSGGNIRPLPPVLFY
jgi:hypothetical protein